MIDLEGNPNVPHRVILTLSAEVHELLPNGECRGVIIHKDRQLLQLDGQDRWMTIRKLNELVEELKKSCQPRR